MVSADQVEIGGLFYQRETERVKVLETDVWKPIMMEALCATRSLIVEDGKDHTRVGVC